MPKEQRNLVFGLAMVFGQTVTLMIVMRQWQMGELVLSVSILMMQLFLGLALIAFTMLERLELKFMQDRVLLTFKRKSKGEDWATSLGWFIPRKYRHVIGDILEDCAEMRKAGCTERRIKFHVVFQWLITVITIVHTGVTTSITEILKHVISPP